MQKLALYTLLLFPSLMHAMPDLSSDYAKNLQLSSPQTLKSLHKRKLCQTDITNKALKSSEYYRKLSFEALHNCGHPQPEVVMLISDPNMKLPAHASQNETCGVYINFDETSEWVHQNYGTQRMVMHHESAHIVRKHYNNNTNTLQQDQDEERDADRIAAIKAKCTHCTRDFAAYWLSEHSAKKHKIDLLQTHQNLTLADIDAMPKKDKTILTRKTYLISKKKKSTHPINLERALRLHTISVAQGDKLCEQHQ